MEGRISQLHEDQADQSLGRIGNRELVGGAFEWSSAEEDSASGFLADAVAILPDGSLLVAAYDLDLTRTVLYRRYTPEAEGNAEPKTSTDPLVNAQAFVKLLGSRRVTALVPSHTTTQDSYKLLMAFNDGSLACLTCSTPSEAEFHLTPAVAAPIEVGRGPITSIAWSEDDSLVAVALFNATIVLLPLVALLGQASEETTVTDSVFRSLSGPTLPVTALWFLASTRLLATSLDSTCRVIDTTSGRTVAAVRLPLGPVSRLYPFPNGVPYALAGTTSGHVVLLDTQSHSRASSSMTAVGIGGFGGVNDNAAAAVSGAAFGTSSTIPSAEFATGLRLPHCGLLGARPLHSHLASDASGCDASCAVMDLKVQQYTETGAKDTPEEQQGGAAQLYSIKVLYSSGAVEEVPIENDFNLPSFSCPTAIARVVVPATARNEAAAQQSTPRWVPNPLDSGVTSSAKASSTFGSSPLGDSTVQPKAVASCKSTEAINAKVFQERRNSVAAVTTEVEELTTLCAQLLEQVREKEAAAAVEAAAAAKKAATGAKGGNKKGKTPEPKKRPRS